MTQRSKQLVCLAFMTALTLSLASCGGTSQRPVVDTDGQQESVTLSEHSITLSNGRTVICITYKNGGLSCDW